MKTSPLFFGSHLHACCVSLCILRLSLQRNLMFNKAAAPFYLSPRQESAPVQQAGRACDDCDPIKMCLPACQSWTGLRAALQGRNLWENLKIKHKNNRKHWNWSISWVFISLNPACLCRYIKKWCIGSELGALIRNLLFYDKICLATWAVVALCCSLISTWKPRGIST